ncbi:GNAT family N-acetyltransferase [[Clostridium] polysaccharolyticum]|uniref:Ribosomal-protein-alanine N-acetyltransferase n=1 Tax=[Clostridium] polysaccharolyticum TaxID=29364 RepID=A0A1I0ER17_9FIRM|nr:GNAT family N-acetyltransferase [[Clostridium] polysaccharolyticum]SET47959.1 ribosomal-protein-alanine N-acetyltransferase [[Clostridium] polysaccharolyticum]
MYTEFCTERLILKVLDPNWAPEVLDFYTENKTYFEPWEPDRDKGFYTLEYQGRMLYYDFLAYEKGTQVRFYIFLKNNPHIPIGTISFHNIVHGIFRSCALGYKISNPYKRNGFCLEAVQYACMLMFTKFKIHRIEALIHVNNIPSLKFIEKAGFHREGVRVSYARLNGSWHDHACYSLITPYSD